MTFSDIVYAIGDLIESTFVVLEAGQNHVNTAFIILGFILLAYWLRRQANYNKKAEENGTLK